MRSVRSSAGIARPSRNVILSVVGFLAIFLGLAAWAVSSPIGTSPDDNYHLDSIWCPRPIEGSGCDYLTKNGEITQVKVPETIAHAPDCLAFQSDVPASCQNKLSDTKLVYTEVFDNGSYPWGYYQFQHMFVGSDVHHSVVMMRLMNVFIGLGGLAVLAALASPRMRYRILLGAVAAWVPMGGYYIASNNPSSWTLTGSLIYGAGLLMALEAPKGKRWGRVAIATYGALLCATSRSDALFYLFVISLALWFFVRIRRENLHIIAYSMVVSIVGLFLLFNTGQGGNLTGDGNWPTVDLPQYKIFFINIMHLPEYLGSMWGLLRGPGWFDVPLYGWSTLTMMMLAGAVIFVGAQELDRRKTLSGLVLAGAICGIPVVGMALRHVADLTLYHGRYMLPLVAVFFVIWLSSRSRDVLFSSTGQIVLVVTIATISNTFALRRLIGRYALGDSNDTSLFRISDTAWWPWGMAPTVVWLGGSCAFVVGLIALFIAARRSLTTSLEASHVAPVQSVVDHVVGDSDGVAEPELAEHAKAAGPRHALIAEPAESDDQDVSAGSVR